MYGTVRKQSHVCVSMVLKPYISECVVIMNACSTDMGTLLGPIIHTGLIMVSVGHVLVTHSDCTVRFILF